MSTQVTDDSTSRPANGDNLDERMRTARIAAKDKNLDEFADSVDWAMTLAELLEKELIEDSHRIDKEFDDLEIVNQVDEVLLNLYQSKYILEKLYGTGLEGQSYTNIMSVMPDDLLTVDQQKRLTEQLDLAKVIALRMSELFTLHIEKTGGLDIGKRTIPNSPFVFGETIVIYNQRPTPGSFKISKKVQPLKPNDQEIDPNELTVLALAKAREFAKRSRISLEQLRESFKIHQIQIGSYTIECSDLYKDLQAKGYINKILANTYTSYIYLKLAAGLKDRSSSPHLLGNAFFGPGSEYHIPTNDPNIREQLRQIEDELLSVLDEAFVIALEQTGLSEISSPDNLSQAYTGLNKQRAEGFVR